MKLLINKILLISWIIIGLVTLIFQNEPSRMQYCCMWICYLLAQMENISWESIFREEKD